MGSAAGAKREKTMREDRAKRSFYLPHLCLPNFFPVGVVGGAVLDLAKLIADPPELG